MAMFDGGAVTDVTDELSGTIEAPGLLEASGAVRVCLGTYFGRVRATGDLVLEGATGVRSDVVLNGGYLAPTPLVSCQGLP